MVPSLRRPIIQYVKKRIQQAIENQIGSGTLKVFSLPFGLGEMNSSSFSHRDKNVIDIKAED